MGTDLKRLLILLSEVNGSDQLEDLLIRLSEQDFQAKIMIVGDESSELVQNLRKAKVDVGLMTPFKLRFFFRNYPHLLRELLLNRPHTVLASGQSATYLGMPVSWILRVPKRIHIRHHSNFHHKFNHKNGVLADRLMNFCSTTIVAVSELVKEILLQDEECKVSKIQVIHNGVRLEKYTSTRVRTEEKITFGAVSRFTELKGLKYLASAFVRFYEVYPDSHLEIIGAFSDSYQIVSSILSKLPENSYTLKSSHPEISSFMKSLDCFLHIPIGPYDESFGLVYIEALASGANCIFTKSGILLEIHNIEDYATIVPPCDDAALFSAMLSVAKKEKATTKIPTNELEKYSTITMVENYLRLLKDI